MISAPDTIAEHLCRLGLAASGPQVHAIAAEAEGLAAGIGRLREQAWPAPPERFEQVLARLRPTASASHAAPPPVGFEHDAADRARERAQVLNPKLNCFLQIFDLPPMIGRNGPLAGVPFAFKDAFATSVRRPSAGVPRARASQKLGTSRTVGVLEAAGAIPVGALNLDPDCFSTTGLNPFLGRVQNPRNTAYAVGGSSSGSAAAVAAGIVPFALGTDTGGSIRIPASLCGVLGLRPTQTLLADEGVVALSPSQDTVGILAADLPILRRVLDVLAPGSPQCAGPAVAPIRMGVNRSELLAGLHPDVERALDATLAALGAHGCTIAEVPFPPLRDLNMLASLITCRESFALHAATLVTQRDTYSHLVYGRLLLAACVEEEDYALALRLRGSLLHHVLCSTFADADILICPTIRTIAPRVDGIGDDDVAASGPLNAEFLRLNRPFSLLGLPALSVPIGSDGNGLPIGCQLVGRPFADALLLAVAEQIGCVDGGPA